MKTQIALGCFVAVAIAATVAAFDSQQPAIPESTNEEIMRGLQQAMESRTNVTLLVDGATYVGVPTSLTDAIVTLQGHDEHQRLLMRLDRISGAILINAVQEAQSAKEVWEAAQTKSHLTSWATAKISGTVTLDGMPLAGAEVRFYPTGNKNHVDALTDAKGEYAVYLNHDEDELGEWRVRVYWPHGVQGRVTIPERYGRGSSLTANVKAGENVFDLALQSD